MFVIAGLLSATCNSYTPRPKVELLKFVYDVKSWLNPHIEDLHDHTQPHCFKFVLKIPDDCAGALVADSRKKYINR